MRFKALTDEEIEMYRMGIGEGLVNFQVLDAQEKVSHAGNEMIEIKLAVWDNDGNKGMVFDYLLSQEKWMWKLKNFCCTTDTMHRYNQGKIETSFLIGLEGKCILKMRIDKTGKYPPKLGVEDYFYDAEKQVNQINTTVQYERPEIKKENLKTMDTFSDKKESEFDDDIPF